jgi:LmbE family N-acetylglucosaminyl deacetylase
MLSLKLNGHPDGLRILYLGAHCDDIEIGCGGTIMRLNEEYTIQHVKWVVFTSTDIRAEEARKGADYFLQKCNKKEVVIKNFRDGFLPYEGEKVKNAFEELKSFNPDIVFTHYRHDRHQDHRVVCDLTWNTFRDHLIFEYEIPKYDGDLGNPNCFVPLEATVAEKKVQAIIEIYGSQGSKQWFDKETFFSLLRIRGMESAAKTRYSEAFYTNKFMI